MTLFVHLSDLHLKRQSRHQPHLLERLVQTLEVERQSRAQARVPLLISGDVFDSASGPSGDLIEAFLRLHEKLVAALGGDAPTIVVPGNHDRRKLGLLGPHRGGLFQALGAAVDPKRVFVAGCRTPFLAELVPPAFHGLSAHVVTFDSSYLPSGWLSAGGTIRLEDLLQVHAQLPPDDLPLLLLVHHHLIPTPVTDISHVDSRSTPRAVRWLVGKALPALISNADREELTMTALGAGTALSTLNSFGRAILLLHGHKHVPTARLLRGLTEHCGDLLIASAGSAGLRERVHATRDPDAARLWPALNLVELDSDHVRVEALSFSPKRNKNPVRRELALARRVHSKWEADPVTFKVEGAALRIELDRADYKLTRSLLAPERWDVACERSVELKPGAKLRRYVDFIQRVPLVAPRTRARRRDGRRIELNLNEVTRYEMSHQLCRTLGEAQRSYGPGSAFEWLGLLCRYGASHACLRLARRDVAGLTPFGSVTDLTTGRERPLTLEISDDYWSVSARDCAPRSLLRLYWPLDSH
jgi:DNA repair exonuclease SbcCD nuclease subunit